MRKQKEHESPAPVPEPPYKTMRDWISVVRYSFAALSRWGSRHKAAKVILITFALLILCCTTGLTQGTRPLVTYTLQNPSEVESGKLFDINVLLSIATGWYIYAPTGANATQGMIETKVTFALPDGISRAGKMQLPEPRIKNGYEVLEGSIVMNQSFKAARPGDYGIKGKIIYQSCSTDVCMPPVTEEFTTTIHVN